MNAVAQYFLLYVDSPATSANFYSRLLDKPPVELNPTFALFILDNGVKLGLWSRHSVEPATQVTGGGGELGFPCPTTPPWMPCMPNGWRRAPRSSSHRPSWTLATPLSPRTSTVIGCGAFMHEQREARAASALPG